VGAQRVGISTDSVDKQSSSRQARFSTTRCCPTPTAPSLDLRRQRRIGPCGKRTTFVIGTDQRVIDA